MLRSLFCAILLHLEINLVGYQKIINGRLKAIAVILKFQMAMADIGNRHFHADIECTVCLEAPKPIQESFSAVTDTYFVKYAISN